MAFPIDYEGPTGLSLVTVGLFGKRGNLRERRSYAHQLARDAMGTLTTTILPPSTPPHPGLGIIDRRAGTIDADGSLVPSQVGSTVIGHSRDCPFIIAENRLTGMIGVAHAGRWSLVHGVVDNLIHTITRETDTSKVRCFITGGIRPERFHHEQAPKLVQPLQERHRDAHEAIITDEEKMSLDLFAAIRNDLSRLNITGEQILDDGLCTFEDAHLSSKRADDAGLLGNTEMNWVVVRRTR